METEDIKKQMAELKAKIKSINKERSLKLKNDRYKNDEKFREDKKKRGREYYYRIVKPARVAKAKVDNVVIEDRVVSIDFNRAYD
jgi:hypothetical protein